MELNGLIPSALGPESMGGKLVIGAVRRCKPCRRKNGRWTFCYDHAVLSIRNRTVVALDAAGPFSDFERSVLQAFGAWQDQYILAPVLRGNPRQIKCSLIDQMKQFNRANSSFRNLSPKSLVSVVSYLTLERR